MGKNVPPWDLWLGLREQERMGQYNNLPKLKIIGTILKICKT